MTDAHDEAAVELKIQLGCDCNVCQGFDAIGRCAFVASVSAALRKAAADAAKAEREACANLAEQAQWEDWPGTVIEALEIVQDAIRARAKGGA